MFLISRQYTNLFVTYPTKSLIKMKTLAVFSSEFYRILDYSRSNTFKLSMSERKIFYAVFVVGEIGDYGGLLPEIQAI